MKNRFPPKSYCEYYDLIYKDKAYEKESEFIMSLYKEKTKSNNLKNITCMDFGCGTGNHSKIISEHVSKIYAVDIDSNMLDIASKKEYFCNVDFSDEIKSNYENQIDLCIAMFNIFTFFPTIKSITDEFKKINKCLKKGGMFIFDVWNGLAVIQEKTRPFENRVYRRDNNITIVRNIFSEQNMFEQKIKLANYYDVYDGIKIINKFNYTFDQYLWTPKILSELLEYTGFDVLNIGKVDDFSKAANENDWRIFLVCRKN